MEGNPERKNPLNPLNLLDKQEITLYKDRF